MKILIDKRASTQWKKSSISYLNYQNYIGKKPNRFKLTLVDLLYVSNFKGGNATINESEKEIDIKLEPYSKILQSIDREFMDSKLANLDTKQIDKLSIFIDEICSLTLKSSANKIDGFSVSYLSALLNSYFPFLIPILDRRVLINLQLVTEQDRNKQDQIINIQRFFGPLILKIADLSKINHKSIREIDKDLFVQKIEKPNS